MKKQIRLTKDDIIKLIKKEIGRLGSQRLFAKEAGVTDAYISDVLHGKRGVGPMILKHLNCKTEVRYIKG